MLFSASKSWHRKERKEVCVVAQHFFSPMHWSGFQNRKNFPVCIYKQMHILSQSFLLALKSRAKLFCPIHIFWSNTMLFFLFMLCFCFLFKDLLLLPCLSICSELTTVLQQGKADKGCERPALPQRFAGELWARAVLWPYLSTVLAMFTLKSSK